jgi:transcriptional regulator with XRE-family HTH domain
MSKLASSDDNHAIGARLAMAREQQRLSQVEFAERLGLSPRAYQNYERGERELPSAVLVSLHEVFGLDPLWILIGPERSARKAAAGSADLLEQIIIGVETHLQRTHKKLAAAKKARMIRVLYLHFSDKTRFDSTQLTEMLSLTA